MTDILMPALSPTMEEGTLTKWHIKAGDTVSAGQVIAEIETDKATMEVEAVDEGEVLEILVAEGSENVKVNTPIAVLLQDGESADAIDTQKPAPAKAEADTAIKGVIDRWLADRDFVTREEFDAVRAMAQKAREENAALSARIAALEAGSSTAG